MVICKRARSSVSTDDDATIMTDEIHPALNIIAQFLSPREAHDFLAAPLSQTWRRTVTTDQDIWRELCAAPPLSCGRHMLATREQALQPYAIHKKLVATLHKITHQSPALPTLMVDMTTLWDVPGVQEVALDLLTDYLESDGHRLFCRQRGFDQFILQLCDKHRQHPAVVMRCLQCLTVLARPIGEKSGTSMEWLPDFEIEKGCAGPMPGAIVTILNMMHQYQTDPEVLVPAVKALANLCLNGTHKTVLLRHQGFPQLVHSMKRQELGRDFIFQLLSALVNVARDVPAEVQALQYDLIDSIKCIAGAFADDAPLIYRVCLMLQNLSRNAGCCREMLACGIDDILETLEDHYHDHNDILTSIASASRRLSRVRMQQQREA